MDTGLLIVLGFIGVGLLYTLFDQVLIPRFFLTCPECQQKGQVRKRKEHVSSEEGGWLAPAKDTYKLYKKCLGCGHIYDVTHKTETRNEGGGGE